MLAATAAATVAAGTALALYARRRKRAAALGASHETVELMWIERTALPGEEPMATVTFFEGACAGAAPYLRARLEEIFRLSPWLSGFLANGRCYYNVEGVVRGSHLRICEAGEVALSRQTPLAEMGDVLAPFIVKKGFAGPDEPLFCVALIPDAANPTERFALVASMSHIAGDGHTFYQVHNMLSEPAALHALDAARRLEVDEAKYAALGGSTYHSNICRVIPSMLLGNLRSKLRGTRTSHVAFYVQGEAVDAAKARAQADGARFVSTNDVLTSWFIRAGGFGLGLMPVNFRGRVPGAEQHLAGNYEAPLMLQAADVVSPGLVREGLQKLPRAASDPPALLPSALRSLAGGLTIGICTNWAGFTKALEVPGASYDLHLPVFNLTQGGFGVNRAMCVIFRPHAGAELACVIIAGSPRLLDWLPGKGDADSGIVGALIT